MSTGDFPVLTILTVRLSGCALTRAEQLYRTKDNETPDRETPPNLVSALVNDCPGCGGNKNNLVIFISKTFNYIYFILL